jgi:hypothetical protein
MVDSAACGRRQAVIVDARYERAAEAIRPAPACQDAEDWTLARRILHLNLKAGEMERLVLTAASHARFPPVPPFEPMEDARLWAVASPDELWADLLAAFKTLPPGERRDFAAYAMGSAVA